MKQGPPTWRAAWLPADPAVRRGDCGWGGCAGARLALSAQDSPPAALAPIAAETGAALPAPAPAAVSVPMAAEAGAGAATLAPTPAAMLAPVAAETVAGAAKVAPALAARGSAGAAEVAPMPAEVGAAGAAVVAPAPAAVGAAGAVGPAPLLLPPEVTGWTVLLATGAAAGAVAGATTGAATGAACGACPVCCLAGANGAPAGGCWARAAHSGGVTRAWTTCRQVACSAVQATVSCQQAVTRAFTMQARQPSASSKPPGHDNEPVTHDAVQQASVRQTSCRRWSEDHRQANHAQTGPPLLHGAPGRQEEWATHPRIGRPGGSGALREDRAGLPSVCHLPACGTLPLPCAFTGTSTGGRGLRD